MYISATYIMPIYRVDYLSGEFYIGKCGDLKKRMRDHRCRTGSGLAAWFADKDIMTATIREIGRESETETISEIEDRLIREHLEDPLCLNKNRGQRTPAEKKQQKKESYISYMAEHPEKKAEYDAVYRAKNIERIKQQQKEYYHKKKAEKLAIENGNGKN
jgi:hypothetical protein